jgi:uridylate kinase
MVSHLHGMLSRLVALRRWNRTTAIIRSLSIAVELVVGGGGALRNYNKQALHAHQRSKNVDEAPL